MKLMTLRMSLVQRLRSRSASSDRKDLVNAVAPEPVKIFQANFTLTFPMIRPQAVCVLKVMCSEVKVT